MLPLYNVHLHYISQPPSKYHKSLSYIYGPPKKMNISTRISTNQHLHHSHHHSKSVEEESRAKHYQQVPSGHLKADAGVTVAEYVRRFPQEVSKMSAGAESKETSCLNAIRSTTPKK